MGQDFSASISVQKEQVVQTGFVSKCQGVFQATRSVNSASHLDSGKLR